VDIIVSLFLLPRLIKLPFQYTHTNTTLNDLLRPFWLCLTRCLICCYSSGAAVALYCAMHHDQHLGGCIALSTMMPEKRLPDPSTIVNKDIPYFQAHGESDNILPLSHGIATSKILKQFLPNHEFKTYYCQHECTDRELADVKGFIEKIVGHWQIVSDRWQVNNCSDVAW